jgi:hypothetical protein
MSEYKYNAALTDYLREVICKCPRCGQRARIQATARCAIPWRPTNVTFICAHCVLHHGWPIAEWESDFENFNPSEGREPYFGYELWAIGNLGNKILAILNKEHANELASFIAASDRPRPENTKYAMVNRLPRWIILRKNRDQVLRLIRKLKDMLE